MTASIPPLSFEPGDDPGRGARRPAARLRGGADRDAGPRRSPAPSRSAPDRCRRAPDAAGRAADDGGSRAPPRLGAPPARPRAGRPHSRLPRVLGPPLRALARHPGAAPGHGDSGRDGARPSPGPERRAPPARSRHRAAAASWSRCCPSCRRRRASASTAPSTRSPPRAGTPSRNGVGRRARFVAADWAAPVAARFDLIVSNPPYIRQGELPGLAPEVRHDPAAALDGGPDGLDAYRAILAEAGRLLAPDGIPGRRDRPRRGRGGRRPCPGTRPRGREDRPRPRRAAAGRGPADRVRTARASLPPAGLHRSSGLDEGKGGATATERLYRRRPSGETA